MSIGCRPWLADSLGTTITLADAAAREVLHRWSDATCACEFLVAPETGLGPGMPGACMLLASAVTSLGGSWSSELLAHRRRATWEQLRGTRDIHSTSTQCTLSPFTSHKPCVQRTNAQCFCVCLTNQTHPTITQPRSSLNSLLSNSRSSMVVCKHSITPARGQQPDLFIIKTSSEHVNQI